MYTYHEITHMVNGETKVLGYIPESWEKKLNTTKLLRGHEFTHDIWLKTPGITMRNPTEIVMKTVRILNQSFILYITLKAKDIAEAKEGIVVASAKVIIK